MEGLVRQGLVRNIGMSNYSRTKLEQLLAGGVAIKPAVLQVCLGF
jgi:diketogulonate reductase-like aldo/keto reductase